MRAIQRRVLCKMPSAPYPCRNALPPADPHASEQDAMIVRTIFAERPPAAMMVTLPPKVSGKRLQAQ